MHEFLKKSVHQSTYLLISGSGPEFVLCVRSLKSERKKKDKQIFCAAKSRLLPLPAQEAHFSFSSHMAAHKLEEKVSLAGDMAGSATSKIELV